MSTDKELEERNNQLYIILSGYKNSQLTAEATVERLNSIIDKSVNEARIEELKNVEHEIGIFPLKPRTYISNRIANLNKRVGK